MVKCKLYVFIEINCYSSNELKQHILTFSITFQFSLYTMYILFNLKGNNDVFYCLLYNLLFYCSGDFHGST